MEKNLADLLKRLLENEVEFVLIGGYAGIVHGSNQFTQDLDICAVITPEQIQKIRKALQGMHAVHRDNKKLSFEERPRPNEEMQNLYLVTDAGALDVLSLVTGVGNFETLKKGAVSVKLFEHTCLVISLDDLIKSKKAMNRDKDKIGLKELMQLKGLDES